MEEWTKIPLQVSPFLLDIRERDSVLFFSPGEALKKRYKIKEGLLSHPSIVLQKYFLHLYQLVLKLELECRVSHDISVNLIVLLMSSPEPEPSRHQILNVRKGK